VQGIPSIGNETVIVIPALTIPGTTTIDVFAENNVDHSLYTVTFLFNTGSNEPSESGFSVFPNPASDKVFIYGALKARISLVSASGETARIINDFNGNQISLDGLPEGVYTMKIEMTGKSVITRKLVVM